MIDTKAVGADYGESGERRLRQFIEASTGGRITRIERLVRWRPAWFVDVDRGGETLHLHLRGDREGNISIFPDLRREADVISVLHAHGVPVPRIYGYCEDPPAILMEALPGTRNVVDAASDAERRAIVRQYMAAVAAMHRLPVEPFVAKGVRLPEGAEGIALAGLHTYMPQYERTKRKPEPMLEFVLGWIRRNVPRHRTKPAFIQFDSGQFLFEDGKMTGLYDFEYSMIGDPLVDIATMRMRDSYEPLGDEFAAACRHYEEFTGEPIDHAAVDFHTLLFATLGTMQFVGTVGVPQPGDPHSVYLEFDLSLRQVMLLAQATLMGVAIEPVAPLAERAGDNAALIAKLADAVARIETSSELQESRKDSAAQLIEWLVRADALGGEARERDLADVSSLLGRPFREWAEAEAVLEAHVRAAGPDEDERLLRLFAAIEGRRLLVFGPTRIGRSATRVYLPPLR
jgi:aminoglycoside phosphotransferase (APT) family kinase protein